MRILIVEDEVKAAEFLKRGFSESGFTADITYSADEAETAAELHQYDLFIIDVNLPGQTNGIELLRRLNRKMGPIRSIVLTARESIDDRVAGIEAGANVYLVKPFSFTEVVAYARSLSQKNMLPDASLIRVGDLRVDLNRQSAKRGGVKLELTAKEFSLLALLARRQGHVLSRTVISDQLWGMNFDPGTNVVDVHIRRLRAKVDDSFEKKLIWTVRGLGYVLEDRGDS